MTLINEIPNPSGSVPPIYIKGDTLYSTVVVRAPRNQAFARRETLERRGLFALCARGESAGVGPTYLHKRGHSLLYCRCKGSAEPGLCSQGNSGEDRAFALCAREGLIASNARSGPVPLPPPLPLPLG